ncbi:MAG: hypothetical protein ACRC62_23470 [Microcoleus sp.]
MKLIVFDKDGTLTTPASGAIFVQHPHDQVLLPGVAEKLAQLRKDGWLMAIASNQGGCAKFECDVTKLKEGMWIDLPLADGETFDRYKIRDFISSEKNDIGFQLYKPRWNGKDFFVVSRCGTIKASHKSIDEAAEEMRFAMKLIAPHLDHKTWIHFRGVFCPNEGRSLVSISAWSPQGEYRQHEITESLRPADKAPNYRKPAGGMLLDAEFYLRDCDFQIDQKLMVGDRPEDQRAAEAADFEFAWAKDFFG